MFPPPLRAPLAVLITCVAAVSTAPTTYTVPDFTARTSTSNVDIDGLENLNVTVTIANRGDGTPKPPDDPRGVLNPFPENSFAITGLSGSHPPFTSGSVDYASANPDHSDAFIVHPPGDSVSITHDLPAAHSFTQSGTGYSIKPSNLFTYIDADGTPKDLYGTVYRIAKIKPSGNPAVSQDVHDRRIKWKSLSQPELNLKNCRDDRLQMVQKTVWGAESAVAKAYSSLKPKKTPDAYIVWFGAYDLERKEGVKANFKAIKNNILKFTYECGCNVFEEKFCDNFGLYYEGDETRIRICERFWEPSTDREAALFNLHLIHLDLHSYALDMDTARGLANKNPQRAVESQVNYLFFARDIPHSVP